MIRPRLLERNEHVTDGSYEPYGIGELLMNPGHHSQYTVGVYCHHTNSNSSLAGVFVCRYVGRVPGQLTRHGLLYKLM